MRFSLSQESATINLTHREAVFLEHARRVIALLDFDSTLCIVGDIGVGKDCKFRRGSD